MTAYICNRCNLFTEGAEMFPGYCPNCGCPEHRLMKPQRCFLVTHQDEGELVAAIQELCAQPFLKEAIAAAKFTFEIGPNGNTGWQGGYAFAEWDEYTKLMPYLEPMRLWLEAKLRGGSVD